MKEPEIIIHTVSDDEAQMMAIDGASMVRKC
jgi:hypothetical protein